MMDEQQVLADYLKSHGLKITRPRLVILEAFLSLGGHVSAADLYELLKRRHAGIGFATIYRTLRLFTHCGLASEVNFGDRRTRFEKAFRRQGHGHLICVRCGRTEEFATACAEKMPQTVARKFGFVVRGFRCEIYGLCRKCC